MVAENKPALNSSNKNFSDGVINLVLLSLGLVVFAGIYYFLPNLISDQFNLDIYNQIIITLTITLMVSSILSILFKSFLTGSVSFVGWLVGFSGAFDLL